MIRLIVSIQESALFNLPKIIEGLDQKGFQTEDILNASSGITGVVKTWEEYYDLINVPGVEAVEFENEIDEDVYALEDKILSQDGRLREQLKINMDQIRIQQQNQL